MRLTIPVMIVAAFFLSACETTPKEDASAQSGGDTGKTEMMAKKDEMKKPMGPPPGSQLDLEVNVGDRVFYEFDKSNLKPEARTTIERWAAWLKTYPQNRVIIEGHADERGTREYNLALGERRANAAMQYLVSLGIDANRLRTVSYGKERPAVLGSNENAWAQNRRGVIVLQAPGS